LPEFPAPPAEFALLESFADLLLVVDGMIILLKFDYYGPVAANPAIDFG
jgi:hypothetical protein